MRLIDRYILQEFGAFFGLAFGVTTFVLLLDKLVWLTGFVLRTHLQGLLLLRLLGYMLPTISGFALPVALLLGGILTFNRLSTDSEYMVLQAAGVSFYRLLLPLFGVSIVLYMLTTLALMYGAPWGFQGVRRMVFDVARAQAHTQLQAQEFNDTFAGLVLYIDHIDPASRQLSGIFIADTRVTPSHVITARTGEFVTVPETLQVLLRLHNGTLHRYTPREQRYQLVHFGSYEVFLDLDSQLARRVRGGTKLAELFPAQLRAEIQQRRVTGVAYRQVALYWHTLIALPFTCFIFAGLGPGLGVVQTRSGRSGGYVFGLVALLLYYVFLSAGKALGEETPLPPWLAAWLPNLGLGGITIGLLLRTARGAAQVTLSGILDWLPGRGQHRQASP
jgi:lipopolysaccharide export system permease protein